MQIPSYSESRSHMTAMPITHLHYYGYRVTRASIWQRQNILKNRKNYNKIEQNITKKKKSFGKNLGLRGSGSILSLINRLKKKKKSDSSVDSVACSYWPVAFTSCLGLSNNACQSRAVCDPSHPTIVIFFFNNEKSNYNFFELFF